MIIGIDGNEANINNRVGIGRYAYNVLKGLHRINGLKEHPYNFKIYLKNSPLSDLPAPSLQWSYQILTPTFFWSQIALPIHLLKIKKKPKVLFSISHYAPKFSLVPSIISIMDLSYLHYPEMFKLTDLFKLKYWTAMSVKKAEKIITISHFSKNEIIKSYGVSPGKIIVAYPGVEHSIYKPNNSFQKNDFILYVGTLQPRKNIINLIEAFYLLKNKKNLRLMIIGQKGWLYNDIFSAVKKKGLESKIVFSDYVSENKLISYYQDAVCLVLPSFYEGFGIPVIEAMSCGCPVIAANTSSLPEIVGDAGLLVDPNNPTSISQAIDKIYSDKKLSEKLIKKGLLRSRVFNWENTSKIIYTTLTTTIK